MSLYLPVPAPLASLMVVPLVALAACASGGAKDTVHAAPPAAATDSSSVAIGDAKSIETLFAGRFPGVMVTRGPGGSIRILIRGGGNSFFGSDDPLVVLDGTPLPPGMVGLEYLSPYDIEKIEVLKNPADVAIYGVRGGNGVIVITTKRPGKP